MENPFNIDWTSEKERLLRKDHRIVASLVGVTVILVPLPTIISRRYPIEAIFCLMIYVLSFLVCLFALAVYKSARAFEKETMIEASCKGYEKLLDLCRKFPETGDQCRAAVTEILSRQGYLTAWQAVWLRDELESLGDKECAEAVKAAFSSKTIDEVRDTR